MADGAAADHHPVASRAVEGVFDRLRRGQVAVENDRYRDRRLDLGYPLVVHRALVALRAGAAVNGQRLHAQILEHLGYLDNADALLVPAEARLHSHRQMRRADDARDDLLHLRQVAQKPGPGSAQRHIAHPAAAVDVDEVWILRTGDLGGLLHRQRGRAVELDRQRPLSF